jgi:hypothetical protein
MEQDRKIDVEEIMGQLFCTKDFQCCMSGLKDLCKAKSVEVGEDSHLICFQKKPRKCKFLNRERGYLCECPLRIYLAKKLKK